MADAGNIIDLEDVGTAIMAAKMKVLPQTVKVYTGKLNTMKKYLREGGRHVYLDNDGNIIVPLPLEVIKGLFGWIVSNPNLAKPRYRKGFTSQQVNSGNRNGNNHLNMITVSKEGFGGYKSALKWWYMEKGVLMETIVDKTLDEIVRGEISYYDC